jgi:hypothetical protein
MRVFSGRFPLLKLINEYVNPLLNVQFHGLKAVFSQKKSTGVFEPPKYLGKQVGSSLWANWEPGGFSDLYGFLLRAPLVALRG